MINIESVVQRRAEELGLFKKWTVRVDDDLAVIFARALGHQIAISNRGM